jgi:hypothetical protein
MNVLETVAAEMVKRERAKISKLFDPIRIQLEELRAIHNLPVANIVAAMNDMIDSPHMTDRYESAAARTILASLEGGSDDN